MALKALKEIDNRSSQRKKVVVHVSAFLFLSLQMTHNRNHRATSVHSLSPSPIIQQEFTVFTPTQVRQNPLRHQRVLEPRGWLRASVPSGRRRRDGSRDKDEDGEGTEAHQPRCIFGGVA